MVHELSNAEAPVPDVTFTTAVNIFDEGNAKPYERRAV